MRAADEVIEFIAREIAPEVLVNFRPSESTRQRVWDLVHKEKETGLTPDEKSELDDYERVEHLLILARSKARNQSKNG